MENLLQPFLSAPHAIAGMIWQLDNNSCSPIPWLHPEIFHIWGPIALRWYSLAYLFGLILGAWYFSRLIRNNRIWAPRGKEGQSPIPPNLTEDMLFFATLGVIIGGRLGFVIFYDPGMFATPLKILKAWDGGMSFHGGMIGVSLAVIYVAVTRKIPIMRLADAIAPVAPIGLGLGRIANLINGELYGAPYSGPLAMRFPCTRAGDDPNVLRYPTPLFEAFLEGLLLFLILRIATHYFRGLTRPGLTTGLFLLGYGVFRTLIETIRLPDTALILGMSRGTFYSIPMWSIGLILIGLALSGKTKGWAK